MKIIEFDGHIYQVKCVYCKCYYGNKSIYHVATDNPECELSDVVRYVLSSRALPKSERDFLINSPYPDVSLEAHFLEYYIGRFVDSYKYPGFKGYYEITFIRPYDD